MIYILYLDSKILAEDDGTVVDPMFNWGPDIMAGIQAAFEAGEWEPVPDPVPPLPEPDWTAFNTAMLSDSDWNTWITQNPLLTSATTTASLNQDSELLQATLKTAIAVLGQPDSVADQRWQSIADANFIPIQFGEP
jgi:hypothetical protein